MENAQIHESEKRKSTQAHIVFAHCSEDGVGTVGSGRALHKVTDSGWRAGQGTVSTKKRGSAAQGAIQEILLYVINRQCFLGTGIPLPPPPILT